MIDEYARKWISELEDKIKIMNNELGSRISKLEKLSLANSPDERIDNLSNILDSRWQEGIEFKDHILAECKRIEKPILEYIAKIEKALEQIDHNVDIDIKNIYTRVSELEEKLKVADSTPLETLAVCTHNRPINYGPCPLCAMKEQKKESMNFGEAFELMKKGTKMANSYHDPGIYIYLNKKGIFIVSSITESLTLDEYGLDQDDIEAADWRIID